MLTDLQNRLTARAEELESVRRHSDRAKLYDLGAQLMDAEENLKKLVEKAEKLLASP
jgi:hypothetical protein